MRGRHCFGRGLSPVAFEHHQRQRCICGDNGRWWRYRHAHLASRVGSLNVTGQLTTISTVETEIRDKTLTIGIADAADQTEAAARTNLASSDLVFGQYTDADAAKHRYGGKIQYNAGANADADNFAMDREVRVQGPLSFGSRDAAGSGVRMMWFYRTGADKVNASDKSTVELWRIETETVDPLLQAPNRRITTFHDHGET